MKTEWGYGLENIIEGSLKVFSKYSCSLLKDLEMIHFQWILGMPGMFFFNRVLLFLCS